MRLMDALMAFPAIILAIGLAAALGPQPTSLIIALSVAYMPRTARIVLSGREMGRIYHAKGVERLVRNDLWKGRSAERFYDAMEWLYGWNVGNCLARS